MLTDEAMYFIRLGTFLERADNTARILDVKYLAAKANADGEAQNQRDFYYWAALLRSGSSWSSCSDSSGPASSKSVIAQDCHAALPAGQRSPPF